MEALLETKIFKVSVERLLLNGGQTLYMVGIALLIGTVIGTLLALVLVLCRKGGLVENKVLHSIVSLYINVVRSVPFIILLVTIMPLTRAILGTTIGSTAALVPLVVYISPYLARLIENSLLEVSPGILEAAQAMGDTCKCTQYALPGSEELADQCEKALGKEANSCLLHSHGAVCVGENMDAAFKVATVLEATARILYMIEATGGKPAGISPENVAVMKDFAKNHYGQGK